jgi:drug/metabolite transporter (DMT)-like permease
MVTMITAVIALGERITPIAIAGAIAIVAGMVLAQYKK